MNALTGTQTVPTVNKVPQTMMDEYIKANEIDINADINHYITRFRFQL
jgi:hypothetical protein